MNNDDMPPQKRPLWIKLLIVLCSLPVLAYPALLAKSPAGGPVETFLWFYPVYVVVAAVCAWLCWPSRRETSWILLILMLLTHAAMWVLVDMPL